MAARITRTLSCSMEPIKLHRVFKGNQKASDDTLASTKQYRMSGYLIFLTIAGASIGRRLAQVGDPYTQLGGALSRANESQTLDQMVPFITVGAILGLATGLIAEPLLPKWRSSFWLHGIIATSILWGALGMPPWLMP